MYAVIALLLVTLFALATVLVPIRFESVYARLRGRIRDKVLDRANKAVFASGEAVEGKIYHGLRLWFFISAGVFAVLGVCDGGLIRNHPDAIATVVWYALLAFLISGALLLSILAVVQFMPTVRGYATLTRCGFRGLWILSNRDLPKDLSNNLRQQALTSSKVAIVDVTGYELFVKGTSPMDAVIQDVVCQTADVPVLLLLLHPDAQQSDPDRQKVSVFQNVLAEMGMTSSTYRKKIHETVETIEELNAERSPEAQIQVRFYKEKPMMRAVIFDDSMVVFPPHAHKSDVPCLEVMRNAETTSFYEVFRRDFVRLWRGGVVEVASHRVA